MHGKADYLCVSPDDGVRGGHSEQDATHIARHDPARVLAECAFKRWLIDYEMHSGDPSFCYSCTGPSAECPTLRALAAVYEGRPGWSEAWA